MNCEILILPGWGNSGSGHWQTLWELELPNARRVEQREWINVSVRDWVRTLDCYIVSSRAPVVLVAHSLSCILVSHWARCCDASQVRGALLVAPTDIEETTTTPKETWCFAPIPRKKLPFRSAVVCSINDPYTRLGRARAMANDWGSELINIGAAGHINLDAGYGPWSEGKEILAKLVRDVHE